MTYGEITVGDLSRSRVTFSVTIPINRRCRCTRVYACVRMCVPGTTRRSTRCPGTSPGTGVDLCGIGTATIPTVTPGRRWDSHRRRRSRPRESAFWTRRMPRAVLCPVYFVWRTHRGSWRSCRSASGPARGRRKSRWISPCRNHNLSHRLEQHASVSLDVKVSKVKVGQDSKFRFNCALVSENWPWILQMRKPDLF